MMNVAGVLGNPSIRFRVYIAGAIHHSPSSCILFVACSNNDDKCRSSQKSVSLNPELITVSYRFQDLLSDPYPRTINDITLRCLDTYLRFRSIPQNDQRHYPSMSRHIPPVSDPYHRTINPIQFSRVQRAYKNHQVWLTGVWMDTADC